MIGTLRVNNVRGIRNHDSIVIRKTFFSFEATCTELTQSNDSQNLLFQFQRPISHKRAWILLSARRLMVFDICMRFQDDPCKNNMSPNHKGSVADPEGAQGVQATPYRRPPRYSISYENEIIWSQWDQIISLLRDIFKKNVIESAKRTPFIHLNPFPEILELPMRDIMNTCTTD